jgi:hypothetical protein
MASSRMRLLRSAAYSVYAIVVLYFIAHMALLLRICKPIALQWDPTRGGGHCGDITKQEISSAVMNMILDLFIVLLPMPILWNLRISTKKKVAIGGILSLGLLCVFPACLVARYMSLITAQYLYHQRGPPRSHLSKRLG